MNLEPRTSNFEQTNADARGDSGAGSPRRVYDLEERLLNFAVAVIDVSENLPKTRSGNHIAGQLLRAGTSPYSNHGEAQEPESKEDFIHKMKICLKELRETRRWARLVDRKEWRASDEKLQFVLGEVEELIRIFKSSIRTSQQNLLKAAGRPITKQRPPA